MSSFNKPRVGEFFYRFSVDCELNYLKWIENVSKSSIFGVYAIIEYITCLHF